MRKTVTTTAAVLAAACMLSACGNDEEEDTSHGPSAAPSAERSSERESSTVTATVPALTSMKNAPDIPDEAGEEAVAATAQNFIEQWQTFSPSDFEPKEEWFSRWDHMTSTKFRSKMRSRADQMWSWTWNQDKKCKFYKFEGKPEVALGRDVAAAKVTFIRAKQDLFATVDELKSGKGLEKETLTYMVEMTVEDDGSYQVIDARQVDRNEKMPEV